MIDLIVWRLSQTVRMIFVGSVFVAVTMYTIAFGKPEPYSFAEAVYANAYYQFQAIGVQTALFALGASVLGLFLVWTIRFLNRSH